MDIKIWLVLTVLYVCVRPLVLQDHRASDLKMFQVPLQTSGQSDPRGAAAGDLWEGESQVQQRGNGEETPRVMDHFLRSYRCLSEHQLSSHSSSYPNLDLGEVVGFLLFVTAQQPRRIYSLFMSVQSIAALVQVSDGDLRKAITFLQSAARLGIDKEITERTIIEIAGVRLSGGERTKSRILHCSHTVLIDRILHVVHSL